MTGILHVAVLVSLYVLTSSTADDVSDSQGCFYEKGEWSECEAGTQTLRRELIGGKSQCKAVKVETRSCQSGDQGETTMEKHQPEVETEDTQNRNQAAVVDPASIIKMTEDEHKNNAKFETASERMQIIEDKKNGLRDVGGGGSEGNPAGGRDANQEGERERHGRLGEGQRNYEGDGIGGRGGNLEGGRKGQVGGYGGGQRNYEGHGVGGRGGNLEGGGEGQVGGYGGGQRIYEGHGVGGRGGNRESGREGQGGYGGGQRNYEGDGQEGQGYHQRHNGRHRCHEQIHDMRRKARELIENGDKEIDVTQFEGYTSLTEHCQKKLKRKVTRMRENYGHHAHHHHHDHHHRHGKHGCHEKLHGFRRKVHDMMRNENNEIDVTKIEGYSSLPEHCQEKLKRKVARMRERHGQGQGQWGQGSHGGQGGHGGEGGHGQGQGQWGQGG